jgi:hypothetical protein
MYTVHLNLRQTKRLVYQLVALEIILGIFLLSIY